MAFGSALRSPTNDYLRAADLEGLRRRMELTLNDLFSHDENIRLSSLRSLATLGSLNGLGEREVAELIRTQNLLISIVNSRVTSEMLYAEIHPKLTDYGDTPREFARPKRVEEFYAMDGTTIDRILQSYNLPRDIASLRQPNCILGHSLLSRDRLTLGDRLGDRYGLNRDQRLVILFEFLGLDLSSERLGVVGGRLGLDRIGLERDRLGGGLLGSGLGGLDGRRIGL